MNEILDFLLLQSGTFLVIIISCAPWGVKRLRPIVLLLCEELDSASLSEQIHVNLHVRISHLDYCPFVVVPLVPLTKKHAEEGTITIHLRDPGLFLLLVALFALPGYLLFVVLFKSFFKR